MHCSRGMSAQQSGCTQIPMCMLHTCSHASLSSTNILYARILCVAFLILLCCSRVFMHLSTSSADVTGARCACRMCNVLPANPFFVDRHPLHCRDRAVFCRIHAHNITLACTTHLERGLVLCEGLAMSDLILSHAKSSALF